LEDLHTAYFTSDVAIGEFDASKVVVLDVEDDCVVVVAVEIVFTAADDVGTFDASLDSDVDDTTDAVCVISRTNIPFLSPMTHPTAKVCSRQVDKHILRSFILV